MAGDVVQEAPHHDHRRNERDHEPDCDNAEVIGRHLAAVLVEIIGEGADHGRDRQEERKLRRRALFCAQQHRRDDAGARARDAGNHGQALREADPQIHHQRKFGGVVLVRMEIELIDPHQDRAADDQREAHHPRIEEKFLDVLAGDQADDNRGQESHQHADHEPPVVRVREHAERDLPQPGEVEHDDREYSAELNQHDKTVPECAVAKAEETLHQQHVAGRGNRQKFRDALDDAENHCPYCIRHHDVVHFCCKSRVLLAYSQPARNRKKTLKHRLPRASAGL